MSNLYDICIIGSGPAGAFAANHLAKNNKKVILVDAGNKNPNSDIKNNFDLEKSKINGSIDFGFSQQIGGSSNLWAGQLSKINEIDLESRTKFNFLKWPLDFEQLENLYDRVKKIIGISNKKFSYQDIPAVDLREAECMDKPFNTSVLVEGQKNLTLLVDSTVTKINLDKEKNSVVSVMIFNSNTSAYQYVKAKNYILASGTISNVRILLDGLRDLKTTKPEFYNSIGSYFSTHPKAYVGKIKFNEKFSNNPLIKIFPNSIGYKKFYFGLKVNDIQKSQLLNHCLRIESIYALRMTKILDYFKKFFSWIPFISKNTYLLKSILRLGVIIFQNVEKLSPKKSFDGKYIVRGFFDQESRKDNRIFLSSKKSDSGLPLAIIDWTFNENDWKQVDRFMETMKYKLEKHNIGSFEYSRPSKIKFTGIHSHFIGGTRIGESPINSVVDKNLKVHHLDNLYISGPSVFPSFGYANPFLTIAALSLRLADHLLEK